MYTRNNISQQLPNNHPCETSFLGFRSRFTERTINDYILSLRGDGSAIAHALMEYRSALHITLKYKTIAHAVGCCRRTVIRWIKKFVHDGFLTKTQVNDDGILNIYTPNRYNLGLSKSTSYAYWSQINPEKSSLYNDYGILVKREGKYTFQIETVTPIKSYINKYIYKQSHTVIPSRVTCAGVKEPWDISNKKETSRSKKLREIRVMLQEEQRKWIQRSKNNPALKEMLLKEPLKSHIFTSEIEEVSGLLELTERERLKLVAFPDDAIENLLSVVKPIVTRTDKRAVHIKDRVAWIMSTLSKYCKSHNFTVDWKWYFDICEILGIEALNSGEISRPLKFDGPSDQRNWGKGSTPDSTTAAYVKAVEWKSEQDKDMRSIDEKIDSLEKDVELFELELKKPVAFPWLLKYALSAIDNKKQEIAELKAFKGGV